MRVLADLDPHRLEAALLDTVAGLSDATPARRVVVLVPTARLARHVERRLAGRRDAWLGVEVRHLRAAARAIVERDGPAPTTLTTRLLDRILGAVLRRRREGRWPEIVRGRPGALLRLRASLTDLRESGIAPGALLDAAGDDDERELAAIHSDYVDEIERLAEAGLPDEAALTRDAVAGAADWLGTGAAVVLYGAYELNGIQLDLLRAIDSTAETLVMVPCATGTNASRYAQRWATAQLDTTIESAETSGQPGCGLPLESMFDEPSRPEATATARIRFRHTQGQASELRAAMRDALAAVGEGCPPDEIAIVARSLAPYAAAVDAIVEETGVPVATSVGGPLRREPLIRDALTLIHAIGAGLPRRETAAVLATQRIDWSAFAGIDTAPRGDDAERWSRGARIVGGLDGWARRLPEWLASTHADRREHRTSDPVGANEAQTRVVEARELARAATIAGCVETLDHALPRDAARFAVHADNIERLLDRAFGEPAGGEPKRSIAALRGLLDEMRRLDALPDAGDLVGLEIARGWLESAVDGTTLPRQDGDRGIRVLDAMQARGMTFRHVALVGLNAGRFPQQGTEDPILSDELRRRLIEATGRPLPIASGRIDEERLLLALNVGSASERLDVSWQRADESGRSRTPSLALRELARLAHGTPDVSLIDGDQTHHPSHPEQLLDRFLARPGLLSQDEAILLDALRVRDVDQIDRLAERYPELADGVRALSATQSFAPTPATAGYDGRVGRGAERTVSVSALETLGNCPLKYFFGRVLGVSESDDEPDELELPRRELGTAIHDLLEAVYVDIRDQGGFSMELDNLLALGQRSLEARRGEALGQAGAPIRARAPGLWELLTRRWFAAVSGVIREDLSRLHRDGFVPVGFEHAVDASLDLGDGQTLPVRGRLDRRMRSSDGELVTDYKTSESVVKRLDITQCLKGRQLQLGLYSQMVEGTPAVELIAIHPDLRDDEAIQRFAGLDGDRRTSFMHTIGVLAALERDGVFPLRKDRHCTYCAYEGACRRNHPPTEHREEIASDAASFRLLSKKSKSKPFPPEAG